MEKTTFTPQPFTVSSDTVESKLHDKSKAGFEKGFVKTGLQATEKVIDILRYAIYAGGRASYRRGGLSLLSTVITGENSSLKMTPNGEIVLDLEGVSQWGYGYLYSYTHGTRESILNILAEGIKKFILKGLSFYRGDNHANYKTVGPLEDGNTMVMKTEDGGIFNFTKWDKKQLERWLADERHQVWVSPEEVRCIYEILKCRSSKKLISKYGDVYRKTAVSAENPMETAAVNGLLKKLRQRDEAIEQQLVEINKKYNELMKAEKQAAINKNNAESLEIIKAFAESFQTSGDEILKQVIEREMNKYKTVCLLY